VGENDTNVYSDTLCSNEKEVSVSKTIESSKTLKIISTEQRALESYD
jgi:hypothetical protein